MKSSKDAWENEYASKNLMTGVKPAKSLLSWIKHVIKIRDLRGLEFPLEGLRVLDLGSGEGKNALYLAELGAHVCGIEIASNAVTTANDRFAEAKASDINGSVEFVLGSIGEPYKYQNKSFDLVVDVTSSNSLSETERSIYLSESARVLKPDGQMFVRALCKDGDKNAKYLLKHHPGPEYDTYIQPDWGLVERVFSESNLRETYEELFSVKEFSKETHYTTIRDTKYKRNFWVAYLEKR